MRTIRVRGKTGADGVLHLSIQTASPEAQVEAVVVMQVEKLAVTDNGWPPGFFEDVIGSITDETFFPSQQGEHEKREEC